jgi:hypothetical protein
MVQQQLDCDKPQSAQGIHLEKLWVICHMGAIEFGEQVATVGFGGQRFIVEPHRGRCDVYVGYGLHRSEFALGGFRALRAP